MMKKTLLIAGSALLGFGSLSAKVDFYPANTELMGEVSGVSASGRYATVDNNEMNRSYLWDRENPEEFTYVSSRSYRKVDIMDVSDECIMVGQVYLGEGKYRPAIRKGIDGDWELLPTHPETLNSACAMDITADGKYIVGYEMVKGSEVDNEMIKGAYYPCVWTLMENGEYEHFSYFGIPIPNQQGFLPSCISEDGSIIGGYVHAGATDGFLPAMIKDGKYIMFDTVEEKLEPWYYKGQIMGYDYVTYIDGFKDTESNNTFFGAFNSIDKFGNLYGCRTTAENVDEEGNGDLVHHASVYNVNTDEWYYYDEIFPNTLGAMFSCGYDRRLMFCNDAGMVRDDMLSPIEETLGFGDGFTETLTGITHMSADTMTLGGIYAILNTATMENQYYPFMLVSDMPLTDITGIEFAITEDSHIAIVLSQYLISVAGAKDVAVYDLNGRLMGRGDTVKVNPGTYIVKADNASRTVMVR